MRQIALKYKANNTVIYNIDKTKAVLFSQAYWQKFAKLLKTILKINKKTIYFKKKTT